MKKGPRKLKLSRETLRNLTESRLSYIKGGISGEPRDGCGETNGNECPSDALQTACTGGSVSSIYFLCTC